MTKSPRIPALLVPLLLAGPLYGSQTLYVPGAAETTGLNNAVFSSTLFVSNLGAASATVQIGLIPYAGKSVPAPASRTIAAGATLRVERVLGTLWNLTSDAGTLTLTSDAPLSAVLTTANIAN